MSTETGHNEISKKNQKYTKLLNSLASHIER